MTKPHAEAALDTVSEGIETEDLLLVGIADERVLVRLSEIKKVLRAKTLTAVPMAPAHLKGLANVHGQIVCIIDAGGVTSLPLCDEKVTDATRFLLLRHAEMHVGIWVDAVYKVQQLERSVLAKADESKESIESIVVDGIACPLLQCSRLLH